MAPIQSLPTELLAHIFDHLYEPRYRFLYINIGDPSLFPCAIARVCQLWRGVVSQRPEYWTHITFDLAAEEPLLIDAFGWAKETEFQVLVFDSRYGPYSDSADPGSQMLERRCTTISKTPTPISADHERAMVFAITEALLPHLERCYSLIYSTSFSDSLPEATTILQNASGSLKSLRLDYRTYDSHFPTRALKYNCDSQTRSPGLHTLSIDVVAFMLMMEGCPQVASRLFPNSLPCRCLELSNYQFDFDHNSNGTLETFNVTDFIHQLSRISHADFYITLRGLSMAACGRHDTEAGTSTKKRLTVNRFVAVDLSEDFLQHLFQQVDFVGGLSTGGNFSGQCKFPVNTPALSFRILCLHGLPLDANLPRLLTGWTGLHLTITSCPCFNDALLDMLAERGTSTEDCLAPALSFIVIRHCENFSRRALMNFFVKRNNAAVSSSYLKRVKSLKVDGIRVQPSAEELPLYQ